MKTAIYEKADKMTVAEIEKPSLQRHGQPQNY